MTAQIVEIAGQQIAVLPAADYRRLLEIAEELDDIAAAADAAERRRLAGEEYVPFDLVRSIIDGKNALAAWREYRGLSVAELAGNSGISQDVIAGIEVGGDAGSQTWRALAEALSVDIEDIIP